MSPTRSHRDARTRRRGYRPRRDRRELWTAVAVAALIVIVTASFVWLLRPNRGSSPTRATDPGASVSTVPATAPPPTTVTDGGSTDGGSTDGGPPGSTTAPTGG